MTDLVVRRGDLGQGPPRDLRIRDGRIVEVGEVRPGAGDEAIDAAGGAVVPGLHDHHRHLLAEAAAQHSVAVGPPAVTDAGAFGAALRRADRDAPGPTWLRAVGYHESVAGRLDRHVLDRLLAARPLRVQHRSGIEWVLNSAGLERLGLLGDVPERPAGTELGADGTPTGRLVRADRWLGEAVGRVPPDLAAVAARAAERGVTGFTDATPAAGPSELRAVVDAVARGVVRQRVMVMTGPGAGVEEAGLAVCLGPVKVLLDDDRLPGLDALSETIAGAHREGRPVAVHCVTRVQLVVTLSALAAAGAVAGDRIEHASVVPAEMVPHLAALGVTVVTNPGFVRSRGDAYRVEVEEADRPDLYRCRTLVEAGVPVAGGSDAPYGPADPWRIIAAATDRRTAAGAVLGRDERLGARRALDLFLGSAREPGTPRQIVPGAPGDLCVLSVPLEEALRAPSAEAVALCVIDGQVVADRR